MDRRNVYVTVAVIVILVMAAIAAAVVITTPFPQKEDDRTPAQMAEDALDAINKVDDKQQQEFSLIDDQPTTATLCSENKIGARASWVTITIADAKGEFDKDKADKTFNERITKDMIQVMSITVPSHHILYKDGLVEGIGYWYNYPDAYSKMEYIGYNSDGQYMHLMIKLADKQNEVDDDEINMVIKAVVDSL